jgi:hypothetical protein
MSLCLNTLTTAPEDLTPATMLVWFRASDITSVPGPVRQLREDTKRKGVSVEKGRQEQEARGHRACTTAMARKVRVGAKMAQRQTAPHTLGLPQEALQARKGAHTRTCECWDAGCVGCKAHAKHDGVLLAQEAGDQRLHLLVLGSGACRTHAFRQRSTQV